RPLRHRGGGFPLARLRSINAKRRAPRKEPTFAKRQCAIRNERDRPNQDADNNERPPLPNGHRSPRRSGPKFLFQFGYETARFQNLEHIRRESAARHHVTEGKTKLAASHVEFERLSGLDTIADTLTT